MSFSQPPEGQTTLGADWQFAVHKSMTNGSTRRVRPGGSVSVRNSSCFGSSAKRQAVRMGLSDSCSSALASDERDLQMTDTQLRKPQHPAFLAVAERRSAAVQRRVADTITAFAGSMRFVYPPGIVFALKHDESPRGK